MSIWLAAPKERTAAYFPTYSAIAREIQAAMRLWAKEWFYSNPEVLARPHTAMPLLLYICTIPFRGKPTHTFTYDPHSGMLDEALSSAAFHLNAELQNLATKHLDWHVRELYFPYRRKFVVEAVRRRSHALIRMLHVDTAIMEDILKFATLHVPTQGLQLATRHLQKCVTLELARFSSEIDLRERGDELIAIATAELSRVSSRWPKKKSTGAPA